MFSPVSPHYSQLSCHCDVYFSFWQFCREQNFCTIYAFQFYILPSINFIHWMLCISLIPSCFTLLDCVFPLNKIWKFLQRTSCNVKMFCAYLFHTELDCATRFFTGFFLTIPSTSKPDESMREPQSPPGSLRASTTVFAPDLGLASIYNPKMCNTGAAKPPPVVDSSIGAENGGFHPEFLHSISFSGGAGLILILALMYFM